MRLPSLTLKLKHTWRKKEEERKNFPPPLKKDLLLSLSLSSQMLDLFIELSRIFFLLSSSSFPQEEREKGIT